MCSPYYRVAIVLCLLCIPVCYDLYYAIASVHMCPYLHLPYTHALLCQHGQGRVRPAGPHHIHSQAAVLKLLFRLQEGISIQPDVSLQSHSNKLLQ